MMRAPRSHDLSLYLPFSIFHSKRLLAFGIHVNHNESLISERQ